MEQRAVIDETFAGLVSPSMTFEMGRPDIVDGRPGAALVEEVQKFDAEGGFKRITEDRETARIEADQADAAVTRKPIKHADLGIVTKGSENVDFADGHKD